VTYLPHGFANLITRTTRGWSPRSIDNESPIFASAQYLQATNSLSRKWKPVKLGSGTSAARATAGHVPVRPSVTIRIEALGLSCDTFLHAQDIAGQNPTDVIIAIGNEKLNERHYGLSSMVVEEYSERSYNARSDHRQVNTVYEVATTSKQALGISLAMARESAAAAWHQILQIARSCGAADQPEHDDIPRHTMVLPSHLGQPDTAAVGPILATLWYVLSREPQDSTITTAAAWEPEEELNASVRRNAPTVKLVINGFSAGSYTAMAIYRACHTVGMLSPDDSISVNLGAVAFPPNFFKGLPTRSQKDIQILHVVQDQLCKWSPSGDPLAERRRTAKIILIDASDAIEMEQLFGRSAHDYYHLFTHIDELPLNVTPKQLLSQPDWMGGTLRINRIAHTISWSVLTYGMEASYLEAIAEQVAIAMVGIKNSNSRDTNELIPIFRQVINDYQDLGRGSNASQNAKDRVKKNLNALLNTTQPINFAFFAEVLVPYIIASLYSQQSGNMRGARCATNHAKDMGKGSPRTTEGTGPLARTHWLFAIEAHGSPILMTSRHPRPLPP